MIDLNGDTRRRTAFADFLYASVAAERRHEPARNYLGASLLGGECQRALQFAYFNAQVDPGKEIDGRRQMIFDRGHWAESYMAQKMIRAGFDLRLKDKNGRQYEFSILDGKVKGHCDGVLVAGPNMIKYPALWENKCLGCKYWKQLKKDKLKKFSSTYYGQVQIMMAYFELTDNPALFTAINADTMELYDELVTFDAETAQRVSDGAVQIIGACEAGELLPRISTDPSFYKCKWCDWAKRCLENS